MSGKGSVICVRNCSACDKEIEVRHARRVSLENIFCSKRCEGLYRKSRSEINFTCPVCDNSFHIKPKELRTRKTCSHACDKILRSEKMMGEGNHQFGLKGSENSSWKSDERISYYGYKLIRVPNHPFRMFDDFIFEHRLIAEKYLLKEEYSVEIDGQKYLKKELVVHHKDKNKLNNEVSNLEIMTLSEHRKLHAKEKRLESLNSVNC